MENILLEHRYRYYILGEPIISDYSYDMLEREYLKVAPEDSLIRLPGSDLKSSYPEHIINKFKDGNIRQKY